MSKQTGSGDETNFHMDPDAFRQLGYQVVNWIATYMAEVDRHPVLSRVKPGEIRSQLPSSPPAKGEPFHNVLDDLQTIILPGITHWQSPNFYAFFPANNSGPSILGELLSAGLGVQGMMWATSPACTELESLLMDWLVEMLDLPRRFHSSGRGGGVIQDTASSATLCALLAARERATSYRTSSRGCTGGLVAYSSNQAHASVEKAVRIAGIGTRNLRLIDVNDLLAMRPDALERQILLDREKGLNPFFTCATLGTTSSQAMDPVAAIGEVCRKYGLWLHVDAAMCGTAAICPEFRYLQKGLNLADSYCFNPHKWMFVNFDCDCFFLADRHSLIRAMTVMPEYLRNAPTESGAVVDYRDWQIPLGRRFRALKLWLVIRHYGVEGLRFHIREHVRIAREFRGWVESDSRFELPVPTPLNLVCFRHRGGDPVNERILEGVNRAGHLYMTHTRLDDQYTLRMSIGQTQTRRPHVRQAWALIQEAADQAEFELGLTGRDRV